MMDLERLTCVAKTLSCLIIAAIVSPALAARPVTVQQLEQTVESLHKRQDGDAAKQLSELQLTERMNASLLRQLKADLPGEQSRQALRVIADESQFQNPPSSEIPVSLAPNITEQRRIMGLVVNYVTTAIPQLPNFIATRTTDRFESSPQIARLGQPSIPYEPIHLVASSLATTLYRDNREVEETHPKDQKQSAHSKQGLSSRGEFGYILSTVLLDAAQNKLEWRRWEQGDSGKLAVFAFSVPREKSHFELSYCCVADSEGNSREWHELVGYAGQMAIDPATGAIQRIAIDAELKPGEPISSAKIAVEYGRVDIGGRTYTCPVHSIAFSRAQGLSKEKEEILQTVAHGQRGLGMDSIVVGTTPESVQQTLLNDVTFTDYHVFRSEARIVADAASDLPPPGTSATQPVPSDTGSARRDPTTHLAISDPEPAATFEARIESARAPVPVASPPPAKSEPAENPEISVATEARLPDIPAASSPGTPDTGFHLRSTSRLVEVTVVAFDKKGRPVTDLKPGDLEVYDNGRKQTISTFNQAQAGVVDQSSNAPHTSGAGAGQLTLSNIPANSTNSAGKEPSPPANTTIFLIDASNVAFGDLTRARSEMLRFLKSAAPDEPAGLYVLNRYGFQILQEPTTDHAALAATLSKWMPSAQDLAQAADEEMRNRQQMEYVRSENDLLAMNGNTPTGEGDISSAPDIQRRSLGDRPEQNALGYLVWVARHLAAFKGHKSLIWVASDNVLADFSEKAPQEEKGDKYLDPLSLRAREALNEAQVSIYPLDCSQLEVNVVGANLQRANVQVNPTSTDSQLQGTPGGTSPSSIEAQQAMEKSQRDINPGRLSAQMQQDTHPIQPVFHELAEATGGRALRRASDIAAELDSIVNDGRAAYALSFTPDTPADGSYHHITVKLANRRNITLRYRTGYLYEKEPVTLKERFQSAVWRPADITEIGLSATPASATKPTELKLNIAAADLALVEQAGLWMDKLDIFVIKRDDAALQAKLDGQTLALRLKPATYEKVLKEGISVDESIQNVAGNATLRFLVVDENTGRIGSLTIAPSALATKP